MFSNSVNEKAELYSKIFSQLKSELKWKVSDQRTLMIISSMYVVNGKLFDLQRLLSVSTFIKDNVGAFSTLRSYLRFNLAAMMLVRFDNPEEKFLELVTIYNRLIEKGFVRGTFTYLAALSVMSAKENAEVIIEKAYSLYKAMKKEHFFLTSASDYPLAALLANKEGTTEAIIARMEYFYGTLSDGAFSKNDHLQFLSHILSLDQNSDDQRLVNRCTEILFALKQKGIKTKANTYPAIGLLSLLENGVQELDSVIELTEKLNSEKPFKWYKDVNFMMAVNFIVSDKLQNNNLIETGIYTTIESIIQAQQAAMTAAMISASVAASSGGGE